MYIAMNRFQIAPGREEDFLEVWRKRDSHLSDVPGFKQFNMLQGASQEEHTVFISHSVWESEAAFRAWTQSEAFRKAHAGAKSPEGIYLGPPKFEGYEVVL
ncbi:MAG: antibiotic biosynthesis monooxygenase family protein [Halomonas sp.]|uniref:antibiotic biosynthesis monooxygenase family protein n=1 Tax=Halomonas TaxID=2745 RepID=UPI000EDF0FA8|nr:MULTISPECIES: antibiotic biosynthesis monooxygenase [Halomonas]HCR97185.1 antibiotic biosynthesis monooxygenase [Halomonas sp.]